MCYNQKKNISTVENYMALELYAPYQLINGELVDWPHRTVIHQLVLGEIFFTCAQFHETINQTGTFLPGPIDVLLDNWNVLTPDLIYITEERKNIITEQTVGVPDLVIEVLHPENAYYDLRPKKDIYEKFGVREYLIFDPKQENAELYLLEDGQFVLKQKAAKTEQLSSIILPGLTFDLAKIFT